MLVEFSKFLFSVALVFEIDFLLAIFQFSFFDAMARRSLWDFGLNYEHATGHGIGAYLNVHETPPLISSVNSWPGMMKNMFTSNGKPFIGPTDYHYWLQGGEVSMKVHVAAI